MLTRMAAFLRWSLLSAALLIVSGCGDKTRNYTPSVATAESALRKGLDAWQAGKPGGEIPDSKPAIHIVDVNRKPGQTLTGYRILGEARGPSGRTFAVALSLNTPREELKTQYIVVGIDPLWVFRQDDYELLSHWDHHMPAAPATESNVQATEKE